MKKFISFLLAASFILSLSAALSISTAAFIGQLDALYVNANAYGAGTDLGNENSLTINSGDRIYILGWIAFSKTDGLKEVKYRLNGKDYACSDVYRDRADVAAAGITVYSNGKNAGYGTDLNMMELVGINTLAAGKYTLSLVAYSKGGASEVYRTYDLTVKSSENTVLDYMQINEKKAGDEAELKNAEKKARLKRLTPAQKEGLIRRKVYRGMTNEEISAETGMSVQLVNYYRKKIEEAFET